MRKLHVFGVCVNGDLFFLFAKFSSTVGRLGVFANVVSSMLQTYPSIRGRTIFRAKDRLALTKGILDSFFDMGVLQASKTTTAVSIFARLSLSHAFL